MSNLTLRRYATCLLASLSLLVLCASIPAAAQTITGEVYLGDFGYPSNDDTDHFSQQNPAVAVNPATNRIYVSRIHRPQGGHAVIEVNGSDNSIIREIPLPVDPHGIAINTNSNRLYLPSYTWNAVMVYDVTNGTMEVVPIPYWNLEYGEPCRVMGEVAVNPNSNRIYITCWNGRVAVMNGADNSMQVIRVPQTEYEYGMDYYGAAADPTNNRAFLVGVGFYGFNGGSMWAIDILDANNNVTRVRAPAGMGLSGAIAFNPVTNRLYLTAVDETDPENKKPGVLIMNGADHSFNFVQIPDLNIFDWWGYGRNASVGVNPTTNRAYVTYEDRPNFGTLKLITLDGLTHAVTVVSFPELSEVFPLHAGWGVGVNPNTGLLYLPISESLLVMSPASSVVVPSEDGSAEVTADTATLSFPNISAGSTVTVEPDQTTAANYSLPDNLGSYEITTTGTYDTAGYYDAAGNVADPAKGIKVAFSVPSVNDEATFNGLVITHGEDTNADGVVEMVPYNGAVDPLKVTHHDFATRTVWVFVPHLSPFVIVKGEVNQLNDLIELVKTFNLKQGIYNSFDTKLQNAQKALEAAKGRDRASACHQIGAFSNEAQAQSGRALTTAQAQLLLTQAAGIRLLLACQ